MVVHIELAVADRDAVLLALAWLSLDRPGWFEYLRGMAAKVGGDVVGRAAFDEFRRLNADRTTMAIVERKRCDLLASATFGDADVRGAVMCVLNDLEDACR